MLGYALRCYHGEGAVLNLKGVNYARSQAYAIEHDVFSVAHFSLFPDISPG